MLPWTGSHAATGSYTTGQHLITSLVVQRAFGDHLDAAAEELFECADQTRARG